MFSRRGFSRDNSYAGFGGPQAGNPYATGNPYASGNPYAGGNPNPAPQPQGDLTSDDLYRIYQAPPAGPLQTGRMTIDDVVMRTAMTLGTVVLGALVGWFAVPEEAVGLAFGAALIAMVIGFVVAIRRSTNPALILTYAALEGVFLGVISHAYNDWHDGVVSQAVIGTMAVFGGMLVAYKVGAVRVTPRYTRVGIGIAIGFLVLILVNLLAAAIGGGDGMGLRTGALGVVVGVVGVLLGAFFLSLDFHEIEQGVRYGAPQKEAWLGAFGLTLSLVWIYLELLRLLSILRD
ncbi:Bax inhibitor-1/YccA family protein [Streptomyces capparidis]